MEILRDFIIKDIEVIVQLANNTNVSRYLTSRFPQPYTSKDAEWWVNIGSKVGISKAIEVNGKIGGVIGVTAGEYEHSRAAEVGFWLGEQYWGMGVATRAVEKMTEIIFESTEIVRLFAPVFSPNVGSMKVLKKCGYRLEGVFKNAAFKHEEFLDEHVFAKLKT